MRSQQDNNHNRASLDNEDNEIEEREDENRGMYNGNRPTYRKHISLSQSLTNSNLNTDKEKKKKKRSINREINYLARKIERSSISDSESDESSHYHPSQSHNNLQGFISELTEMINNDKNAPMKYRPFNLSKFNYVQREDDYIKITVIKSNVDLSTITREFIIGEKGLPCSQKTYARDYISFGRQQINEDFKRPNDIMLFPTDPSISRSHCKIFHKRLFTEVKLYKQQEKALMKCNLPLEFILTILEYLKPRLRIALEDNETIYGTYCKVQPLSSVNILINLYLTIHLLNNSVRVQRKNELVLDEKVKEFLSSHALIQGIDNKTQLLSRLVSKERYKEAFDNLGRILNKHCPDVLLEPYSNDVKEHCTLMTENNKILNESMVFLTSPKNGLIVKYNRPLLEMLMTLFNDIYPIEKELSTITIFSHAPIFNEQAFDIESHLYKLTVYSKRLILGTNVTFKQRDMTSLRVYDSIMLIETMGDPCGIMNRVGGLLFIYNRAEIVPDTKSFSFNLNHGFLLGRSLKRAHRIDIESDLMLYYSPINYGSWMLSDITLYTNPKIYDSELYFGLWICTSYDKFNSNRFAKNSYMIGENDEVRISETVLRFEFKFD